MSSDWSEYCIDDIKAKSPSSIAIGPFGSRMKSDCYVESGVRVVRGTNLSEGPTLSGEFVFISPEKAAELGGANLDPSDLVFPHRGAIGEVGIIPDDDEKYVLSSSLMKLKCDLLKADPKFIYYFFKSSVGRFELLKNSSQVGTPGIGQPLTSLKSIRLRLPNIAEQKRISAVLGSLDNRITLLRETNQTLEAIAQALFKSWFVDFDPVRAKSEGRVPEGMDETTAALFPDGLEMSELGEIPRGWQVCSVDDLAERVGMGPFGSNIKVDTFVNSGVPVISGQHLKQHLVEDVAFNFITIEHAQRLAKSCVEAGDVIFTHAGNIGQVSLLHKDSSFPLYILSQRQFFLRCKRDLISPEWALLYFKSRQGQHQLLANASQVGVPSIARPVTYLRSIRLVIPPVELNRRFAGIAEEVNTKVMANRKQLNTLIAIRDSLLPRLISGQLRLPDAEAEIEALAA